MIILLIFWYFNSIYIQRCTDYTYFSEQIKSKVCVKQRTKYRVRARLIMTENIETVNINEINLKD